MVVKTTDTNSRFQHKNSILKRSILTQNMCKNYLRLSYWLSKTTFQPEKVFNRELREYWVFLQTDFCVETARLCPSFWVPLKKATNGAKKIWQFLAICILKWSKEQNSRKIWADCVKRELIWVPVTPKGVESVKYPIHQPCFFIF